MVVPRALVSRLDAVIRFAANVTGGGKSSHQQRAARCIIVDNQDLFGGSVISALDSEIVSALCVCLQVN